MKIYLVALVAFCAAVSSLDERAGSRRHYGLSFSNQCRSFQRVFKCMSACKAMSYQVFRLTRRCRCTCHEMKTTTILPFFKWRTNGTTRAPPRTQSVSLYHIVGTLSPPPTTTENATEAETTKGCEYFTTAGSSSNDSGGNTTSDGGNDTGNETGGDGATEGASDGNGSATGDGAKGSDAPAEPETTAAPVK